MPHAYVIAGETEQGIRDAVAFAARELGAAAVGNPDIQVFRYGLLSVEDARSLRDRADLAPLTGDRKFFIIAASRLFHEAQNALLKLFEEPPAATTLMLVIPSEGMLLPTLRSRLATFAASSPALSPEAQEFLAAKSAAREKLIAKLLDRTKSDKEDDKQAARLSAIRLLEGLECAAYEKWQTQQTVPKRAELQAFLDDLQHFIPLLHDRSAPLKLIFEHVLLTAPV